MDADLPELRARLEQRRDQLENTCRAIISDTEKRGRSVLDARSDRRMRELLSELEETRDRLNGLDQDIDRCGGSNPVLDRIRSKENTMMENTAAAPTADWARRTAEQIVGAGREQRAISTGVLDVPSLVLPYVTPLPWPTRITDLLTSRVGAASNAIEYFTETARTNNADVVADAGTKPTSVFTITPIQDHCRVIAHVSEAIPVRLLQDVDALQPWLIHEMSEGLLAGLERQVILGSGSGEDFKGLFTTAGTTTVHYSTDPPTSIRKGLTALQNLGEKPNAIVLNPSDAETIDLTRWGSNGGFLTGGFQNDTGDRYGTSDNIFGPTSQIARVISPTMPSGWAILADWTQLKLFVREGMSIMLNFWSDTLFTTNQYIVRAEFRCVSAVIRPQSFAVISLHSGS
jgi:HK97 family phage major capsid protein